MTRTILELIWLFNRVWFMRHLECWKQDTIIQCNTSTERHNVSGVTTRAPNNVQTCSSRTSVVSCFFATAGKLGKWVMTLWLQITTKDASRIPNQGWKKVSSEVRKSFSRLFRILGLTTVKVLSIQVTRLKMSLCSSYVQQGQRHDGE